MLIYYFIYTSTPDRRSPKIHVSLFKWFEQHASIFPVKSRIMRMRIVKCAPEAIDCDKGHTVRKVTMMACISKYTAQHTLTSDLSMSHVTPRQISIECLKLLLHKVAGKLFCSRWFPAISCMPCGRSIQTWLLILKM